MEGVTSAGLSGITRPTIKAASKAAQAEKVKAVKMKVKVSIKKKVGK
jgi:hypothetical protein